MNTNYFFSAEEAAEQLGLQLLLETAPFPGVPRIGLRLSELAPDPILGARLYHRLDISVEAAKLVIWVVSPWETSEHLAWAIALAEQTARAGRVAYLVDLDRASTLRPLTRGPGRPVPSSVESRLATWGVVGAAAWAGDLQGVRIVLPTDQTPRGDPLDEGNWTIILAGSLPDSREAITRIGSGADRVVMATGFRDHPCEELKAAVAALREAEAPLVGLVAMGPISRRRRSALDRQESVGESPLEGKRDADQAPSTSPVMSAQEESDTGERVEAEDSQPQIPVEGDRAESEPSLPRSEEIDRPRVPLEPKQEPIQEPEPEPAGTEAEEPPEPVTPDEKATETVAAFEPELETPPTPVQREATVPSDVRPPEPATPVGEEQVQERSPEPSDFEPGGAKPQPAAKTARAAEGSQARQSQSIDLFAVWQKRRHPSRKRTWVLMAAIIVAAVAGIVWLSDSIGLLPFKIMGPSSSNLQVERDVPPPTSETGDAGPIGEKEEGELISPSTRIEAKEDLVEAAFPPPEEEAETVQPPSVVPTGEETTASEPVVLTEGPGAKPAVEPLKPEVVPEPEEEDAVGELEKTDTAIDDIAVGWENTFVVHVSSFRGAADADAAAAKLKNAGLPARVVTVVLPDRGRWDRVVVGSYPDSLAANRVAQRLRAEGLVSFAQILGNGGAGTARYIGQR